MFPTTTGIWNIGSTHAEQMINFLKTGSGRDVEFTVGNDKTVIKAHKSLLMARSTFFLTRFVSDTRTVIPITEDDCTADELQLFLEVTEKMTNCNLAK